jgi:hypothetical protein
VRIPEGEWVFLVGPDNRDIRNALSSASLPHHKR